MKILKFYDGVYIDFIYQNMRLIENFSTRPERQSVVVSERLEVNDSVTAIRLNSNSPALKSTYFELSNAVSNVSISHFLAYTAHIKGTS